MLKGSNEKTEVNQDKTQINSIESLILNEIKK